MDEKNSDVICTYVSLKRMKSTGELYTSVVVKSINNKPIKTIEGQIHYIKPEVKFNDKAENINKYKVGHPVFGHLFKNVCDPYDLEFKDDNDKNMKVTIKYSWLFIPSHLTKKVTSYVPKRSREVSKAINVVISEVTEIEHNYTGKSHIRIKVISLNRYPVKALDGQVYLTNLVASKIESAEYLNFFQVGKTIRVHMISKPSEPYDHNIFGNDGKVITIRLDKKWIFIAEKPKKEVKSLHENPEESYPEPEFDSPNTPEVPKPDKNTGMNVVVTIFFIILWLSALYIFVESDSDHMTNAEWTVMVAVTFGLLYLYGKTLQSLNEGE